MPKAAQGSMKSSFSWNPRLKHPVSITAPSGTGLTGAHGNPGRRRHAVAGLFYRDKMTDAPQAD